MYSRNLAISGVTTIVDDKVRDFPLKPERTPRSTENLGLQSQFPGTRAFFTWAIVFACVVVYVLMVAATNQRPPLSFSPDKTVMLEWGAEFGPSLVYRGEVWRLATCMFLHFGLVHLLLNMYCLAMAGPLVERLFGHIGFVGLYVISGVAGSLASLCVHPTVIAAGASGAIFGVFGGLLAFLTLRRHAIPAARFKPMAKGALAFVGYNTIFALSSPEIDMAAHLGGLAGGFVYGLLLTGATPVRSPGSAWLAPALKRLAVLAACSVILAASWPRVSEFARGRILADPVLGPKMSAQLEAQEAWNKFYTAAEPVLEDIDRGGQKFNERLASAKSGETSEGDFRLFIVGFHRDCLGLEAQIKALPAGNDEIRQMRQRLQSAQASLREMLEIMVPVLGMRKVIDGPKEFSAASENYAKAIQSFRALVDDYFRAYSLERPEKKERSDAQGKGEAPTGRGRRGAPSQ